MSGSGGYYKYRCKYFLSHNCPNWVYVNHTSCANCCAEGREAEGASAQGPMWRFSHDICVPRVEGGVLHYTLMEMVNTGHAGGSYLEVRHKASQQPHIPAVVTTHATPGTAIPATTYC
ncbi:hypothetical protein F4780DRAFT_774577 [Xylariomycetidae sp. FL0641]|nr:hypothetical protein F4780DRAFT_774577 [Xylariomycetidae sp. FL0641]